MKLTLEAIAGTSDLLATLDMPMPPDERLCVTLRMPRNNLPLAQLQIEVLNRTRERLQALASAISDSAMTPGQIADQP